MAWLRAVAGQNTPAYYKVEYDLTGLTTTGSDTAPAYSEFTFVLAGSGNRVPPGTIIIYCDGTLLTSNTDYTYNRNTGEVKIKRVAGDILVEAVGVIVTDIWSPAVGYTNCIILRNNRYYYNAYEGRSYVYDDGYWVIWFSGSNMSYRVTLSASSQYQTYGEGEIYTTVYFAVFPTAEEALNAVYNQNTNYSLLSTDFIRKVWSYTIIGETQVPGTWNNAAYGNVSNFIVPTEIHGTRSTISPYPVSGSLVYENRSVLAQLEYGSIKYQS